MPHFRYYYQAALANCAPALGAAAAAGDPAPRLVNLANAAGAAVTPVLVPGIPAAGLGAVPALAGCAPYTWAGLANAAVRIGLYPAGVHPAYETNWRVSSLRVAGYTQAGGRLRRTPIVDALDAGEKRGLSYQMGIVMAVYTAGITGFTFPMHLSRYAAAHGGAGVAYAVDPAFAAANLPDIVFVDPGAGTCQIWEAKGRGVGAAGGGFPFASVAGVLNGAIDQTRKIATLHVPGAGLTAPNARIASVARIHPVSGRWHMHVADPPGKRGRQEGDPVAKAEFYLEFYRPFLELVGGSSSTVDVAGVTFVVAEVRGTNVRVGLDQRIVELFDQGMRRRRRVEGGDPGPEDGASRSGRRPEEITEAIEEIVSAGYAQDPSEDGYFVSNEGVFTEAPEDDLSQPPS